MEQKDETNNAPVSESLEGGPANTAAPAADTPPAGKAPKPKGQSVFRRFNIYFLLFILIIAVGIAIAVVLAINAKSKSQTTVFGTQELSQDSLKQLANSDVTVGDAKQVLTVQSNAIFGGKMLVRESLEVAGALTVGGNLTLPAISVTGTGTFDEVKANKLTLTDSAVVQGQVSIQRSLSVNGSGTFNGALTAPIVNTGSLQLNGDFTTAKHIIVTGTTPSNANGSAVGGGGTSSVSGSDTAGSVTINTGSNPGAGCFANVTFAQRFNTTPKVLITPIGSAAGTIDYYVNRTATGFSICTSTPAPGGQSFGFDYFVLG